MSLPQARAVSIEDENIPMVMGHLAPSELIHEHSYEYPYGHDRPHSHQYPYEHGQQHQHRPVPVGANGIIPQPPLSFRQHSPMYSSYSHSRDQPSSFMNRDGAGGSNNTSSASICRMDGMQISVSVPNVASTILSAITSRALLPRQDKVNRVVNSLLDRQLDYSNASNDSFHETLNDNAFIEIENVQLDRNEVIDECSSRVSSELNNPGLDLDDAIVTNVDHNVRSQQETASTINKQVSNTNSTTLNNSQPQDYQFRYRADLSSNDDGNISITQKKDAYDEDNNRENPDDDATISTSASLAAQLRLGQDSRIGADGAIQHTAPSPLRSSSLHHEIKGQNQIFDPTNFNTIIRGMGGMGKTSLAALVVSQEEILSHFSDGIGWITLGQRNQGFATHSTPFSVDSTSENEQVNMSYQDYCDHLRSLCKQLNVHPPEFEEIVLLPGDSDEMRKMKTLQAMENTRQDMANLMRMMKVLLVLDDVWHMSDLNWFSFGNRPTSSFRLLVTTRLNLIGAGLHRCQETVIDLGVLSEEEAIRLLFSEADSGRHRSLSPELSQRRQASALKIVRSCGCLPVAVRASGRVLASVLSRQGGRLTIEELVAIIEDNDEKSRKQKKKILGGTMFDGDVAIYDILDRSFSSRLHGSIVSKAMIVCFMAFALVFSDRDCYRAWVPFSAIELLWEGLLLPKERQALGDELGNSVVIQLLEKMEALGLVDSMTSKRSYAQTDDPNQDTQNDVNMLRFRIHHDLLLQYSMHNLYHNALPYEELHYRLRQNRIELKATSLLSGFIAKNLQKLFLDKKNEKRILEELCYILLNQYEQIHNDSTSRARDPEQEIDIYMNEYLPLHIMKSGWKIMKRMAFYTLRSHSFLRGRMKSMGIERGTHIHISDTEKLVNHFHYYQSTKSKGSEPFYMKMRDEVMAVYQAISMHFKSDYDEASPAEIHQIGNAYVCIGNSLQRLRLWIESIDFFGEGLKIYRSQNLDESNTSVKRALTLLQASTLPKLVLVPKGSAKCVKLINAEKLRNRPGERSENVSFELSSHPGLGLVSLHTGVRTAGGFQYNEVGVGPKDSALRGALHGNIIKFEPNHYVLATVSKKFKEGDHVIMVPGIASVRKRIRSFHCFEFSVTEEGCLYPLKDPDFVLGIGSPLLTLVSRDSPCRVLLEHNESIIQKQLPQVGHDVHGEEGVPLTLRSHPGYAISAGSIYRIGTLDLDFVHVSYGGSPVNVSYDGRMIARSDDGLIFRILGARYKVGSPVILIKDVKKCFTRFKGCANDWVINQEGSISPKNAPNLALGCALLGNALYLSTPEDQAVANAEAKKSPKPRTMKTTFYNLILHVRVLSNINLDRD